MTDMKKVAKPLVTGLGLRHVLHHGFLGGAIVGAVTVGFLKTKTARNLAVKGMAAGMNLKDDAKSKFATLKEEAEQLHEEAKAQAREDRKAECAEEVCTVEE
ncbi:MAG: YtxH domain-containing protein [Tissierellia bacterium]|nr:YtxH domain-containing protein [Tissierellia bacterium]